jgi:hypothetical protein
MSVVVAFLFLSALAGARSADETVSLLKKNRIVECNLEERSSVETGDGRAITRSINKILTRAKPEPSSQSDFATYSLEFENENYKFYYFMNSQIGGIRIANKRTGFSSESDLDIADLDKSERLLGRVMLNQNEHIKVRDPVDGRMIEGSADTNLEGTCWLAK